MSYTIQASKNESVPAGHYQNAIFQGVEKFASKEGKELLRWKFKVGEQQVNSITGTDTPTTKNQLGKNLCGISNQPLKEGTEIKDPNDFIGRQYFILVVEKGNGTVVTAISQIF